MQHEDSLPAGVQAGPNLYADYSVQYKRGRLSVMGYLLVGVVELQRHARLQSPLRSAIL